MRKGGGGEEEGSEFDKVAQEGCKLQYESWQGERETGR